MQCTQAPRPSKFSLCFRSSLVVGLQKHFTRVKSHFTGRKISCQTGNDAQSRRTGRAGWAVGSRWVANIQCPSCTSMFRRANHGTRPALLPPFQLKCWRGPPRGREEKDDAVDLTRHRLWQPLSLKTTAYEVGFVTQDCTRPPGYLQEIAPARRAGDRRLYMPE